MLCFQLDKMVDDAAQTAWGVGKTFLVPGGMHNSRFYALPVTNSAFYMTDLEHEILQKTGTHYRYVSAQVRLSNFETHAYSMLGGDVPQWNQTMSVCTVLRSFGPRNML